MSQNNSLYELTVRVRGEADSELPPGTNHAFVNCYSSAPDYESALRQCVLEMAGKGYIFEDLVHKIREVDPAQWDKYIKKSWPEFIDDLPSQDEVLKIVKEGGLFFGPFMAF